MNSRILYVHSFEEGRAVAMLVEALRYKPEIDCFDSWWGHWNFSLIESFGRTVAAGRLSLQQK